MRAEEEHGDDGGVIPMGRARVIVRIVDVDGSLAKFIRQAPTVVRNECMAPVRGTSRAILRRMETKVQVGPEAPHLRDDLSAEVKGLGGRIGILEDVADKPAAPGSDATQGEVALYNEYRPDRQPFMGNSARAEADSFQDGVAKALQRAARNLSSGV